MAKRLRAKHKNRRRDIETRNKKGENPPRHKVSESRAKNARTKKNFRA